MEVKVIEEAGFLPALLGLGLSFGLTSKVNYLAPKADGELIERLTKRAAKLADKDLGHNKFMESITVWLDVTAPRFWWSEFDTYRIGVTKQSESTMHTICKKRVCGADFEYRVPLGVIEEINDLIGGDAGVDEIKNLLPDGFLQRRIITTNYKTLRHILLQRMNHRLPQWRYFCGAVEAGVKHPELLPEIC